jgi:PAS domain S-box-containing protein
VSGTLVSFTDRLGHLPETRRLRRQLQAVAFILVLASGLLVALALDQQRVLALESGDELNKSLARVVEAQAASAVQAVEQRLQLTAQGLALLEASGDMSDARVRALLREQAQALPFVRSIWWLDAQGRVMHAPEANAVGLQLADREFFQAHQRDPLLGLYLGSPVRSRSTGRWLISATRPLRDASGAITGILAAGLDPPYFDRLWQALDLGPGGAAALLRYDGTLLMRSPFLEAAMGQRFDGSALFSHHLAAEPSGHYTGPSPVDGQPRLNAYRSLAGPPGLVVLVARSADDVLAPWRRQAWITGSIWAAAVTVVGLLMVALERAWRQRLVAATEARETAERLTLATEAAGIGVWDWDLQHDRWQASATWYTLLGLVPESGPVPGDRPKVLGAVHPDDRAAVEAQIQAALEGADAPYRYEARMLHTDGSLRWVQVTGRVLARDSAGKASRLLGVRIDITERQQLMLALAQSQARLRATLDALPDLMFEIDLTGRYHDHHTQRPDLLAAPPEAFTGRVLSQVLPAEAAAESMAALHEAAATGYSSGRQIVLDLPLGRRWFELSVARRATLPDEEPRFIVLSRDVTERHLGEAEVRRSLAEKAALLKEVHHRVKNNLQIVNSLLSMEARRSVQPVATRVLQDMRARIQSMALLHELIYRSGRFAGVDLGDYLRQVATQALRAQQAEVGTVRLQLELASTSLDLDHALPCGLLVNELISNSLKHGFAHGRGGQIDLSLQVLGDGAALRLCVSDDGVGLPSDFDARRGQSLGLQLVADLVQQLDGRLDIGPAPAAVFSVVFEPTRLLPEDDPS